MSQTRKKLLFGFLLFQTVCTLHASHIVGGELDYVCLGNNMYAISLTIYRDCYNGNPNAYFDNPASIGVFDTSFQLVTSLDIALMGDDTLEPVLSNPCFVVPPNVCVHTTTYRDTLELPFRPGGYILAYQRCCRNKTIANIILPDSTGATFMNVISEEALMLCNSSAHFKEWPPIYICAGEPIHFDHSALDADGDSLVYSLCVPLDGAEPDFPIPQPPNPPPYLPIQWQDPPYSISNVMGGVPLQIDSHTGLLTGTPNTIGQFVVGICVEEYRNGELISTSRRDFQYNVGICGQVVTAAFDYTNNCTYTIQFNNLSDNTNQFTWFFDYPDNPGAQSSLVNPEYTYPDSGTYQVALIAAPGDPCTDTTFQQIVIHPAMFNPSISANPDTITLGESSQLSVTYVDGVSYQWEPSNSLSQPDIENPVATPDSTTTYTVHMLDSLGCASERSIRVVVIYQPCAEPYVFIPNAFSPNGDGHNDFFTVRGDGLTEVNLIIYDRWGEKIFETDQSTQGWDGMYQGKLLPPDVYGYYLRVRCFGGAYFVKKGNVTLLR